MTILRIYESNSRELLYDGDTDDEAITLLPPNEIKLHGQLRRVVNTASEPGMLSLWVASL